MTAWKTYPKAVSEAIPFHYLPCAMVNSSSSTLPRKNVNTGVKKTGVKKTGKKSTGKKKPTSSTSAVHLAAPYNPYPANTQYAPNYAPLPQTVVIEKPSEKIDFPFSDCNILRIILMVHGL